MCKNKNKFPGKHRMRFNIIELFFLVFFISASWMSEEYIVCKTQSTKSTKRKAVIQLKSISFNHKPDCEDSDAIDIMMLLNENDKKRSLVPFPEWENEPSSRSYPITYIANRTVTVIAEFCVDDNVLNAKIWAEKKKGELGNLRSKQELIEFSNATSHKVTFELDSPTPEKINTFNQEWHWYCEEINGKKTGNEDREIDKSYHDKIFIVFAKPQSPWYNTEETKPWVDVLEKIFTWTGISRANDPEEVAVIIAKRLFCKIGARFSYEPSYTSLLDRNFDLEKFIKAMPGDQYGSVGNVNCYDMAKALVTFANIVGCNLEYVESSRPFGKLKPLKPIGRVHRYPFDFFVHSFAWIDIDNDNKIENNKFYDATFGDSGNGGCKPVIRDTWEKYKTSILKSVRIDKEPKDYDFSIGEIEWGISCLGLPSLLKKVKDEYKFESWHRDTGKKFSPDISVKILQRMSDLTQPIDLSNSKKILKESLKSEEKITGSKYSVEYQNWKVNGGQLSVKIVKGDSMEEIKKYLIYRYASWSYKPKSIPIDRYGYIGFKIEEKEGEGPLRIDFIIHNVLIMLKAEDNTRNELLNFAETVNNLKIFQKTIDQTVPMQFQFHVNNRNYGGGGRKVIVQVKEQGAVESRSFKIIKPENRETIFFQKGDLIRIFPVYGKERDWPADYYVIFPNNGTWQYCNAVERTEIPRKPCSDVPLPDKFRLIFHAPKNFPPPVPIPIDNNQKYHLVICGGMPPIWWVEIIPPKIKNAIINALTSSNNVEVGDDKQPQ